MRYHLSSRESADAKYDFNQWLNFSEKRDPRLPAKMQRVLSLQMARGNGESSEFVTKRMCFSFLFSVGFLSLLCGFLLGRFATQRAIEFRAEKKRLELAGNGLESTEYLQNLLLQQLERAPLDADFQTYVHLSFCDFVKYTWIVFKHL